MVLVFCKFENKNKLIYPRERLREQNHFSKTLPNAKLPTNDLDKSKGQFVCPEHHMVGLPFHIKKFK